MIFIVWLFGLPSDAVTVMLSPLAFFWGYLLIRDAEHRKLGVYWLIWTVVLTYALSINVAVLHGKLLIGLAALALSVGETWLTWRLLRASG